MFSTDFTNAAGMAIQMEKITAEEVNKMTKISSIAFIGNKTNTHFCIQHTFDKNELVMSMKMEDLMEAVLSSELNVPRPKEFAKAKQNARCVKVEDTIILVETCCPLCGKVEKGWGHNADPLGDFRCCAGCNTHQVIPARINKLKEQNELLKVKGELKDAEIEVEKFKGELLNAHINELKYQRLGRKVWTKPKSTPLAQRPHTIVQPEENRQKYEDELLKMCEEEEDKQPKQQKTQKKKKEVKDRKPPKVVYINGVPVRLDALRK